MEYIYNIVGAPNVFRYRSPNQFVIDELYKNYLFFPDRLQLNDPFDAHKSLIKVTDDEAELNRIYEIISENLTDEKEQNYFHTTYNIETIRKFAEENVESYIEQFGIACFSMKWHNMPLWSSYASNHSGICLHFNLEMDLDFFGGIKVVNYEEALEPKEFSPSKNEELIELFFRKDSSWAYEEELRLIKFPKGKHNFKKEALKTVFLGYNIIYSFKIEIVQVLKEFYPNVKIYQINKPTKLNRLLLSRV